MVNSSPIGQLRHNEVTQPETPQTQLSTSKDSNGLLSLQQYNLLGADSQWWGLEQDKLNTTPTAKATAMGRSGSEPRSHASMPQAAPPVAGPTRQDDLFFPEKLPPGHCTHHDGRWTIDPTNQRVWVPHDQPATHAMLAGNISSDPSHWIGRIHPDGTYRADWDVYLQSDHPDHPLFKPHHHRSSIYSPAPRPGTHQSHRSSAYSNAGVPSASMSHQGSFRATNQATNHAQWTPPANAHGHNHTFGHSQPNHSRPHPTSSWPRTPFHNGSNNGNGPPGGGPPGYPTPGASNNGSRRPRNPGGGGGGGGGSGYPSSFRLPTRKPWTVKPDISAYRKLRDNAMFPSWFDHTKAQLRAQHLSELLDPNYVPFTTVEIDEFATKQAWFYAGLIDLIQTPTGKAIVRAHKQDFDARQVLVELHQDTSTTVTGKLRQRNLRQEISTIRLEGPWKAKPQMDFLLYFKRMVEVYNETQPSGTNVLTDGQIKEYLESAVYPAPNLRDITIREVEGELLRHNSPYSYADYFLCLETAAQLHDSNNGTQRPIRVHHTDIGSDTPETPDLATPDMPTLEIHATDARPTGNHPRRPMLPTPVFRNISRHGHSVWNMFNDTDRAVLADATSASTSRSVNTASLTPDASAVPPDIPPEPGELSINRADTASASATSPADTAAAPAPAPGLANTHPADPRRLLSQARSPTAHPATAPTVRRANMVCFEDQLHSYWDPAPDDDRWFDAQQDALDQSDF